MKLATINNGTRDGRLVVVSHDNQRCMPAPPDIPTLQAAMDSWSSAEPLLRDVAARLESNRGDLIDGMTLLAPLPRAWQWLDGSAFKSHGNLMAKAIGHDPLPLTKPLMYQGMSHHFIGPTEDVDLPAEEHDIDFEGEFGVILDDVPMGTGAADAMHHIKLVVQVNDWSLRKLAGPEMRTGFGWIQAKPACSVAPFAVTPDELGGAWRDGRVCLDLLVDWNGERFGAPSGEAMGVGFHELVAHASATRDLCAGTIIGSGTVSNENYREIGSSCIAERRGIEIVDDGAPRTGFMSFGDRVRMEALGPDGVSVFGAIDQQVVRKQP
jgi:fumarylacetoacetate (FAA) hydrolase